MGCEDFDKGLVHGGYGVGSDFVDGEREGFWNGALLEGDFDEVVGDGDLFFAFGLEEGFGGGFFKGATRKDD